MDFDFLITKTSVLDYLSIKERAKIKGGLPQDLSIRDIAELSTDDKYKKNHIENSIAELCRKGFIKFYGDINGWYFLENDNPRFETSEFILNDKPCLITGFKTYSKIGFSYSIYRGNPYPKTGEPPYMDMTNNNKILSFDYRSCLINKNDFINYFKSQNQPLPKDCLLSNWFNESDNKNDIKQSSSVNSQDAIKMDNQAETEYKQISDLLNQIYISENVKILHQAINKFWLNADKDDKDTHPKQQQVIDWLVSQGFSKNKAEVGASIIRPKWGAEGRRPKE